MGAARGRRDLHAPADYFLPSREAVVVMMRTVLRRAGIVVAAGAACVLATAPAGQAAARPVSRPASAGTTAAADRLAGHPGPERLGIAPVIVRGAHRLGTLASSAIINVDVMLAPRSAAALQDYATNVSSPGNSLFRHYLTVRQFASRFGPTASAIHTVESSLQKAGLRPGRLAANHLTLPVTATAGQFARAFSIEFQRYRLPGGRVAFANTRAPMFPAAAAQHIQAVIGLDTLTRPQAIGSETPARHRTSAGSGLVRESPHVVTDGPQPCQTAVTAASADSAYTADQLASAYNFSDLYGSGDEGAGVTVGVFELAYNLPSDIAAYQSCYGTDATVNYTTVDGGAGSSLGYGSGEAALDIEDIIGLAPAATVEVYQAPNTDTGVVDEYTAIVDNTSINVVSTSWGTCELIESASYYAAEATLFEQAATEGQSVFAAAGDTGSTCIPYGPQTEVFIPTVDDPSSQPYVTGVGGTSLTSITGPTQTVWNDSNDSGGAGGGAVSSSWPMPAYQSSAPASLNVVNEDSSGSLCSAPSGSYCREVPDVSASADPSYGYLIYYNGAWSGVGGTSAAAPLWAAFTALTDASASCDGTPIGFANPVLYQEAADNYSADFADITAGDNDYTPDGYTGGLYPAGPGYDMASGLGTPNGANLPQALCTPLAATVTNPGNQTMTFGASASLQITAADSGGGALTFSASGLPPGLSISSTGLISGTPTAAGTYPVTVTATDPAQVSGSAAFTITVTRATTATQIGVSTGLFTYGDESAVEFTTYVLPQYSGTPTGTVTVETASDKVLCTIPLTPGEADASGYCLLKDTAAPAGSYTVHGVYSADPNFAASTSLDDVTLAIGRASSASKLSLSAASVTYGKESGKKLSVVVTPQYAAAGPAVGTVTITAKPASGNRVKVCVITMKSGKGSCALSARALRTGTWTLTAAYGGSTDIATSDSPRKTLTVRK
jgi:subtilase family serine protease